MYLVRSSGRICRAKFPQNGHWKSEYSITVTGAFALPSMWSWARTVGGVVVLHSGGGHPFMPEPVITSAIKTSVKPIIDLKPRKPNWGGTLSLSIRLPSCNRVRMRLLHLRHIMPGRQPTQEP